MFYNSLKNNGINDDHIIKFAFDSIDDLNLIDEDLNHLSSNNLKVEPKNY